MKAERFRDELQRVLEEEPERLAPLKVRSATFVPGERGIDGHVELAWRGVEVRFLLQTSPRSAPSVARPVIDTLDDLEITGTEPTHPLLAVPYLSEPISRELQERDISGIDLNGNFCLLTDKLLALRLDRSNQYTEERDIKKIYSGKSSLVGRMLLVEPKTFAKVRQVHEAIRSRGGDISLSTVSKVLKGLAEDLVIEKERGRIRVLQPDLLLDNLRDGYVEPTVTERIRLKRGDLTQEEVQRRLGDDWVWSGTASATEYAVTTPDQQPALYVHPNRISALRDLENERFYSCTARATDDSFVYFDARDGEASPVQAYLELAQGGKRDQEVAETIRRDLLQPFEESTP